MTRRAFIASLPGIAGVDAMAAATAAKEPGARARTFLADLFDGELDLLPEFRGSAVYWLFHDNYLAAAVLKASHPAIAGKIAAAVRGCGVTKSGKIEIVLGEASMPLPFRRYELKEVKRIGQKVIKTEIVTDEPFAGWESYADLRLMAAMAEPDSVQARAHFDAARKVWDGRGFADVVVPVAGHYATYKLGLALRAAGMRGFPFPEADAVRRHLLARQNAAGGFITDYSADGKNLGEANVETTCLCVLGLESAERAAPASHSARNYDSK